jgi:hypothetical protein
VDRAADLVSYDLQVIAKDPVDLEAVRALLLAVDGVEELGDELVWSGTAVTASFLLDPGEVDVGVTSGEAPVDVLRREFLQVLDIVMRVGSLVRAPVYDVQLARALRADDEEAVRDFAG